MKTSICTTLLAALLYATATQASPTDNPLIGQRVSEMVEEVLPAYQRSIDHLVETSRRCLSERAAAVEAYIQGRTFKQHTDVLTTETDWAAWSVSADAVVEQTAANRLRADVVSELCDL